jgi:uncharacterized repeat protein (TIGR03847 family)
MCAMNEPEHDFGKALSIDAEAIGRPGQRRFRLMVRSNSQSASIWMEKQQLASIGTWLSETCERLDREHPTNDPDVEPNAFAAIFDLEFRASQIGLGYAESEDLFAIHAFDVEALQGERPDFRCFLTRGQSRVLARKIESVVAAGRPICPLCSMPMEPEGHVCPRSNGHHPAAVV